MFRLADLLLGFLLYMETESVCRCDRPYVDSKRDSSLLLVRLQRTGLIVKGDPSRSWTSSQAQIRLTHVHGNPLPEFVAFATLKVVQKSIPVAQR